MSIDKSAGLIFPEMNDLPTIARFGVGGAAVGTGAAALMQLLQRMKIEKQLDKDERKVRHPETDKDTIVIRIPEKQANAEGSLSVVELQNLINSLLAQHEYDDRDDRQEKSAVIKEEHGKYVLYDHTGSQVLGKHATRQDALKQERAIQAAKHASTEKRANDPATFALSWLAALAGGSGAYALMRKLDQKRIVRDLKEREDAAHTALMNEMYSGDEKQANTFGPTDDLLGSGLLLTLLGAGATGYITKKIMDEKFKAEDEKSFKAPKVQRIVVRKVPLEEDTDDEKVASDEDLDVLRSALVLHMAKQAGDLDVLIANSGLEKSAQHSLFTANGPAASLSDSIMELLHSSPDLRHTLQSNYMNMHPILKHFKWALNFRPVASIADKMTFSKVPQLLSRFNGLFDKGKSGMMFGPGGIKHAASGKSAGLMDGVTKSLLGSMLADKVDSQGPIGSGVLSASEPGQEEVDPEDVAVESEDTGITEEDVRKALEAVLSREQ